MIDEQVQLSDALALENLLSFEILNYFTNSSTSLSLQDIDPREKMNFRMDVRLNVLGKL